MKINAVTLIGLSLILTTFVSTIYAVQYQTSITYLDSTCTKEGIQAVIPTNVCVGTSVCECSGGVCVKVTCSSTPPTPINGQVAYYLYSSNNCGASTLLTGLIFATNVCIPVSATSSYYANCGSYSTYLNGNCGSGTLSTNVTFSTSSGVCTNNTPSAMNICGVGASTFGYSIFILTVMTALTILVLV